MKLNMQTVAKLCNVQYQGKEDVFFQEAVIDSRMVKKGDLFIALQGEKSDGHLFVEEALEKGAVGAVVSKLDLIKKPATKNLIICTDNLNFLQELAKLIRKKANIPVIAVTGSSGKTTTKDIIASILQKEYKVLKTEGNFNNELGLPLTISKLEEEHEILVVEMGMRGLGQIDFLCNIALPNYGVITNIGKVHAELLGTVQNIAKAKTELLKYIPPKGCILLNCLDKEILMPFLHEASAKILWFGKEKDADIKAENIRLLGEKGSRFRIIIGEEAEEVELSLPGEHNIINSLAAVGIAKSLNVSWESIKSGLKDINLTGMRLQIEETVKGYRIINDVYNANPASMAAAVNVLAETEGNRKVAVLGDMYELGTYELEGHKEIGNIVFKKGIHMLVAVGALGRLIGLGAEEAGFRKEDIFYAEDTKKALDFLELNMVAGDLILVKGSRGMRMERIVQGLMR